MIEEYLVKECDVGKRLDVFLSECSGITRSAAVKSINDGDVTVNGNAAPKNHKLTLGSIVALERKEAVECEAVPENIPIDIVYEDDSIIVVNKPKGMVVHPAAGNYTGTLVNALLYHCKDSLSGVGGVMRPGIVHRIDKDTSGLLVVAKNDNAHLFLSSLLKDHDINRIYYAVAKGHFREECGTVNKPVGRHKIDRKKMATYQAADGSSAREAVTHYRVLAEANGWSLMKFKLETGRTHQIRVHMASIGHPLLGDTVYGGGKSKFEQQNEKLLSGQCLHAKRLEFIHPDTKSKMCFECDFPEYFREVQRKLGLENYKDEEI